MPEVEGRDLTEAMDLRVPGHTQKEPLRDCPALWTSVAPHPNAAGAPSSPGLLPGEVLSIQFLHPDTRGWPFRANRDAQDCKEVEAARTMGRPPVGPTWPCEHVSQTCSARTAGPTSDTWPSISLE
jgi:hypothetical protein